jgi:hypothetical protein
MTKGDSFLSIYRVPFLPLFSKGVMGSCPSFIDNMRENIKDKFIEMYRIIMRFDTNILNYYFSWIGVLSYQKLLNKGIP